MKKNLLFFCFILFCGAIFSQNKSSNTSTVGSNTLINKTIPSFQDIEKSNTNVLWDQPVNTIGEVIWSVVANYFDGAGYGIYAADDFELTEEVGIGKISVGGTQMMGNFEDYLLGFDVFIYNDVAGMPEGNPSVPGSGVLELLNIDPLGDAITIEPQGLNHTVTVDITAANGGEVILPVGIYWVVAFPRMDLIENDGLLRWTWYDAEDPDLLTNAKMIDPSGATGLGIENWTDISVVGLPMDNLAFTIEDNEGATIVNEIASNRLSIYPNPATHALNIHFPTETCVLNVALHNVSGQVINGFFDNGQVDISDLIPGIYILRIETLNEVFVRQIVKK